MRGVILVRAQRAEDLLCWLCWRTGSWLGRLEHFGHGQQTQDKGRTANSRNCGLLCCSAALVQCAGPWSRLAAAVSRRGCSCSIRKTRHICRIRHPKVLVASRAAVGFAEYRSRTLELPFDGCHEFNEAPRQRVRTSLPAGFVESDSFVEFVIPTKPSGVPSGSSPTCRTTLSLL